MRIVLLSGGSGQRLWPLSNDVRSKQFLKLLKNENNEPESMVQRVFRQLNNVDSDSEIVIATSQKQENSIKNQLEKSVDIVIEPERRDTFPAIALSVSYLHFQKKVGLDETVAIMPVDPYTSEGYFEKLAELDDKVKNSTTNLGLLGIKPTYPSSKYGYIIKDKTGEKVEKFVEKPTEEKAAELIEGGAVWNGGVFVFKVEYLLTILSKYIKFSSYEDVLNQYASLPKNSFDYEVSEKETNITMVEYSGFWKDLGTWNTLTEVMEEQTFGEVVLTESSTGTHVVNELNIPVVALGLKDSVVVASPDGILVADKPESAQLKKYISHFTKKPRFEETAWGNKKTLDYHQGLNDCLSVTSNILLKKGYEINYDEEEFAQCTLMIVEGNGTLSSASETRTVQQGDTLVLNHKDLPALRAETEMKIIEVSVDKPN